MFTLEDTVCETFLAFSEQVQGCVDLRYLVLQCQKCESSSSGKAASGVKAPGNMGLNALAQKYLGRTLDKDWRVRASDWEADTLTRRQVKYKVNYFLLFRRKFFVGMLWKVMKKHA